MESPYEKDFFNGCSKWVTGFRSDDSGHSRGHAMNGRKVEGTTKVLDKPCGFLAAVVTLISVSKVTYRNIISFRLN